ncbi:MFS transporter [Denitratisoma sp. DHT3]|uniref:MFS transporter n=1 Tax=Denitratisoma sp. DHT3 TaxID=1981880 RepID=UPI0011987B18|nr:MFS transporter [Denitratisoma sp. DHT3]QDX83001.1 MFS transporter [Denitratisoma sp. DHT3]
MTRDEKRAGISLAAIFALRMLGLFLILPVFAEHAKHIPGGGNLALVGLAMGAYGLTQAIFQIPYGMASDRWGRKRVIVVGLLLFALGSAVAALATDIYLIIAGRVLQGSGAISAAVTALAADLTRDQHRTKVMAMIGSSIGLVFAVSLIGAPALYAVIGMGGLFWLTALLALGAVFLITRVVPDPPPPQPGPTVPFREVLLDGQLMRLNFGIFALHLIQMAMFVVVPGLLVKNGLALAGHWKVYLGTMLLSLVPTVPAIILAERKGKVKAVFVAAVLLLVAAETGCYLGMDNLTALVAMMTVFFLAFNVLEANLPSLISRVAPARAKGAALGVYNTSQAIGLFLGGALGGWLAQHSGPGGVFGLGAVVAAAWVLVALSMKLPSLRPSPEAQATPAARGILEQS